MLRTRWARLPAGRRWADPPIFGGGRALALASPTPAAGSASDLLGSIPLRSMHGTAWSAGTSSTLSAARAGRVRSAVRVLSKSARKSRNPAGFSWAARWLSVPRGLPAASASDLGWLLWKTRPVSPRPAAPDQTSPGRGGWVRRTVGQRAPVVTTQRRGMRGSRSSSPRSGSPPMLAAAPRPRLLCAEPLAARGGGFVGLLRIPNAPPRDSPASARLIGVRRHFAYSVLGRSCSRPASAADSRRRPRRIPVGHNDAGAQPTHRAKEPVAESEKSISVSQICRARSPRTEPRRGQRRGPQRQPPSTAIWGGFAPVSGHGGYPPLQLVGATDQRLRVGAPDTAGRAAVTATPLGEVAGIGSPWGQWRRDRWRILFMASRAATL